MPRTTQLALQRSLPAGYAEWLQDLKARIRSTQIKAALSVNRELISLYWSIGKAIVERQEKAGWGDAVLVHQIETDLHRRQVLADKTTNFPLALPAPQSELVQQTLKDPYVFDFLDLRREAAERELHRALLARLKDFLLELGAGFALLGSEFHLEVDGRDFYVDLLFFHHRLRCLMAIDLKVRDFEPEFAGKMNFYLSALDTQIRQAGDEPSVGLILCKGKSRTMVEYALRDLRKPISVSEYRLTAKLPRALAQALPAPEELERLLSENT